ncbi:Nn.00g078700.m01.CDS01 [Neocucurbitaria sp. VM-36]
MSSTIGFPTVPKTLAAARAVSTSFATVTTATTATKTVFETVRSTAYTTLTTSASTSAASTLLNNVTSAYAAVHHKALQAGTAEYSLAEQLPVLNWVLVGLVSAGTGLHLIRRYRKRKPPVPIPLGQDGNKWRMISRGMTAWLLRALRNNAVLRRNLHNAQQATEAMRQDQHKAHKAVGEVAKELRRALQQAQDLVKTHEAKDETALELREALQKEKSFVNELRQHIQDAEELEKMQDDEIAASHQEEAELQQKLIEEANHRMKLEQEVTQARLPKREDDSTEASRPSNRVSSGINASPSQAPSPNDRSSLEKRRAASSVDYLTAINTGWPKPQQLISQSSQQSSDPFGTPKPWAPLGNVYLSLARSQSTPKHNYGAVYESIERILRRDALIENTPTNPRKRGRRDGHEESLRPAKLPRSSSLEYGNDMTYTPKGQPPVGLSFGSELERQVEKAVDPRLWGQDGLPSIKVEPPKPLQTSIEREDSMGGVTMSSSDMGENAMFNSIVETIEVPMSVTSSRARSRLPVPSGHSPARRSTRAATRDVKSLNERDMANCSLSPEKDDREGALKMIEPKQQQKMPAGTTTRNDRRSPIRKTAKEDQKEVAKTPARLTRSMSPKKVEKDMLTSPIKDNGQRVSKSLGRPKKK